MPPRRAAAAAAPTRVSARQADAAKQTEQEEESPKANTSAKRTTTATAKKAAPKTAVAKAKVTKTTKTTTVVSKTATKSIPTRPKAQAKGAAAAASKKIPAQSEAKPTKKAASKRKTPFSESSDLSELSGSESEPAAESEPESEEEPEAEPANKRRKTAPAPKAAPKKAIAKKAAPKAVPKATPEKAAPKARAAPRKAATPKPAPAPKTVAPKVVKPRPIISEIPSTRHHVFVFGDGSNSELGLGPTNSTNVKRPRLNPKLSADTVGIVQLATGGMHTVGLTHDGRIITWGVNDQGALGRSTDWEGGLKDMADKEDSGSDSDSEAAELNPMESTPTVIPADKFPEGTKFVHVAAGDSVSFAVTDTGDVYGWGTFRDASGIFGFTVDEEGAIILVQRDPLLVKGLKNVTQLVVGENHAIALDSKGDAYAWGTGAQDQLGRRLLTRFAAAGLAPYRLALPRGKVASIHAGNNHSFAILKDGKVYTWGMNTFGQTAVPENAGEMGSQITKPKLVKALEKRGVTMIDGGLQHSVAVTADGECLVWGRMDGSQLGIDLKTLDLDDDSLVLKQGDRPKALLKPTPVDIPGGCKFVAAASDHTIAISREGKAYSWGFNASYQLGQGHDEDVPVATHIDNTAVRGKELDWAGCGGQFSILTAPAVVTPADVEMTDASPAVN
ncbi:RCC1/BLIP-II [Trichodelitschia bisporula]|uniref:RCC1/BLIP-II n=1 Tax=Trichodelitschia bisporula TaxID=703511 RepID=A0A6G1HRV6_9PEZI|nr:RCC1/BLIP-II [Trichodelitschia bisporula]